jgi:CheY-like chemotaxis protein
LIFPVPNTQTQEGSRHTNVPAVPARLRVLVVDDDPMLLKSMSDALEADGHAVVTANGGQAGIDAFSTRFKAGEFFDVVFTDLGMPYIDGRKVAAAIKGISASTPVILVTGWGQRLMAQEGLPENMDRVLSKPPKIAELRSALAECVRAKPPE